MIIDAYAHVSLPRFASAEELLAVMDQQGVQRTILATADTCPDLAEIARAAAAYPQRFRAVGMPLGETPEQIAAGMRAQLAVGFLGIRLPDSLVLELPGLLDVVGEAGGVAFVVGGHVFGAASALLVDFLNRYPKAAVALPHFGGVPPLGLFPRATSAVGLLEHPRASIIFSRQGAYERDAVRAWARWLAASAGWERLIFGSEYPVCVWRDESYASTVAWIDEVAELAPTPAQREAFFAGNARRVLFDRPLPAPAPLDPRWCRTDLAVRKPVWYFPTGTLDVSETTHRKLLQAYWRAGGERAMSFRAFVAGVLEQAAL